jgi:hypothetical protein
LLRADMLFRAVEVPPGIHRVVFAFRPLTRKNLSAALAGMLGRRNP